MKCFIRIYELLIILFALAEVSFANSRHRVEQLPIYPTIWHKPAAGILNPLLSDTISPPESYTMMMVYRSIISDTILPLWTISVDSTLYPISTEMFMSNPVIYTLYHTISCDTIGSDVFRLDIGDSKDTLGHMQLYELAYFPLRLSRLQALMFQTYLALKHGITLHHADYLSTRGDILWHARKYNRFYHRIQGVGSDPFYGYQITQSVSSEDSTLMLLSSDTLPPYSYALIGDNNAPMDWTPHEDDIALIQRRWLMHVTGYTPLLTLAVDTRYLPEFTDTLRLALLSESNEVIGYRDAVSIDSAGVALYELPAGDVYFSFASRFEYQQSRSQVRKGSNQSASNENSGCRITLSPNPTHGDFCLYISLDRKKPLTITIHDPAGKLLHRETLEPLTEYQYRGNLPLQGVYVITVTDDQQSRLATYHLLVY